MRKMDSYPKSLPATENNPNGSFKNESLPGENDGTNIVAEYMQDIYYSLYQVLQLMGEAPNGELENGLDSKQFIKCLTNIGCFKYDSSISYKKNTLISQTLNDITTVYRSQKDNNTDSLSNIDSWVSMMNIDQDNYISIKGFERGSSGFIGQLTYSISKKSPAGWHFLDGTEAYIDTELIYRDLWNELTTGNIISLSYDDYATEVTNKKGNCGFFALDKENKRFKFPILKDKVFIANALSYGDIGKYNQDQLQGHKHFNTDTLTFISGSGAAGWQGGWNLYQYANSGGVYSDGTSGEPRIGTKTYPEHIQYPLLICISGKVEQLEPVSLQEYADYVRSLAITGGYIGQITSNSLNNIPAGHYYTNGELFNDLKISSSFLNPGGGLFPTYLQYLLDNPDEYQTFSEYETDYNRVYNPCHTVLKPALEQRVYGNTEINQGALFKLRLPHILEEPIPYKWQSDWLTIGQNNVQEFDLSNTNIIKIPEANRKIYLKARVNVAHSNYQVGDIINLYPSNNYFFSGADYEIGRNLYFRNDKILRYAEGNSNYFLIQVQMEVLVLF